MDPSQNFPAGDQSDAHHSQFLNNFQATEEVESWQALINPMAALHNHNDNSLSVRDPQVGTSEPKDLIYAN